MSKQQDEMLSEAAYQVMQITGDIAPEPLTSEIVKRIADLGSKNPSQISQSQIQKLCVSVLAHIKPRKG